MSERCDESQNPGLPCPGNVRRRRKKKKESSDDMTPIISSLTTGVCQSRGALTEGSEPEPCDTPEGGTTCSGSIVAGSGVRTRAGIPETMGHRPSYMKLSYSIPDLASSSSIGKDPVDIFRRFKSLAVSVPVESDSHTDNPAGSTRQQKPPRRHKRRVKKMLVDHPADQPTAGASSPPKDCPDLQGTLTRRRTNAPNTHGITVKKTSSQLVNAACEALMDVEDDVTLAETTPSKHSDVTCSPLVTSQFSESSSRQGTVTSQPVNSMSHQRATTLQPADLMASQQGTTTAHESQVTSQHVEMTSSPSSSGSSAGDGAESDSCAGNSPGLLTADEGREGDDELSENEDDDDDARSVYGTPVVIPWWERPDHDLPSEDTCLDEHLQGLFHGVQAALTGGSETGATPGVSFSGMLKRQLVPTNSESAAASNLAPDWSSESPSGGVTSPDCRREKRSRMSSAHSLTGCWPNHGQSSTSSHRPRYRFSTRQRKRRRRSFSAGEDKKPEPMAVTVLPLAEDNLGHQLLTRMGWTPGSALSSSVTSGIVHPISLNANVRKHGLGFSHKQ